jgi:hypothetical protein
MTTQEALHKVEEAGYPIDTEYNGASCGENVQKTLLDPIFWVTLGWSLGWNEEHCLEYDQWWRQPWHRFIDHVSTGAAPDAFFQQISDESRARTMTGLLP